jgi:hypothetical protein
MPSIEARSLSAPIRESSTGLVATMSFPHSSKLMPCSMQKSLVARSPALHSFAFRLPGS